MYRNIFGRSAGIWDLSYPDDDNNKKLNEE